MDRVACVDVAALPLQLLLEREGAARGHPAAVIDRDDPQGRILWVNEAARSLGILPGQRYAAGLSLARDLRAGVVDSEEIERAVERLAERLRRFTPDVEPCREEPGVFWLGAQGLERLWPSASRWAREVHAALADGTPAYAASVAVGFTRFGSYAAARTGRQITVFRGADDERCATRAAPLARLGLEPRLRDALGRLGVTTVGGLLALPAAGLLERFGEEAHRLHRLAAGESFAPLEPAEPPEPLAAARDLDTPEGDLDRLVFSTKVLLDPLLDRLSERSMALERLDVALRLETGGWRREGLRPARPTLSGAQILELVRLRLEATPVGARVEEIGVTVSAVAADFEQLRLFAQNARRDLRAAGRALARLRAELGPEAVVRARLREGHLPEATFLWEPIDRLEESCGRARPLRSLVRRLRHKPLPLPPRPHHLRDDGWLIRGVDHGPVTRFVGPYVVAGGWWVRPLRREYHFACTQRGDILWVYYDRRRRRWFQQGHVE